MSLRNVVKVQEVAEAMAKLRTRVFCSSRASQSTPVFAVSPAASEILSRALGIIQTQARFAWNM
eukprot:6193463-Pleurochrysis_carterae.AAC.2